MVIARECGICQMNSKAKSRSPPASMAFVAAVHPISGGIAPGSAPTIVLNEEVRFSGV